MDDVFDGETEKEDESSGLHRFEPENAKIGANVNKPKVGKDALHNREDDRPRVG